MPIISIISQPQADKIKAAYRPVLLQVSATQTSPTVDRFIPAVVYCDIYFEGVFYKSMVSTTPINKPVFNSINPIFQFDIQDACQEFLTKEIAANGFSTLYNVPGVMTGVECRFRSSTNDVNGFLVQDGPVPEQGTATTNPVSGGGISSNTFYVVNAALQHIDNLDLEAHLSSYKKGNWANNAFPLSHRPNNYRVCRNDSDSFPIIYKGNPQDISCIQVKYRKKGSDIWYFANTCAACVPVSFSSSSSFPAMYQGVPYNFTISLSGDAPYSFITTSKPDFLNVSIAGNQVIFSGTPGNDIVGDGEINIEFSNPCGKVVLLETIPFAGMCTPVAISGSPILPDGQVGEVYSYSIPITGSTPFTFSGIVKPSWMTIALSGSNVLLSGTPDAASNNIQVSFTVNNCSSDSANFTDTIDIAPQPVPFNYTIAYTNNQNIPILLLSDYNEVYNGNYSSDPVEGNSQYLPANNAFIYLNLPGGQAIQQAYCNSVPADTIYGSSAQWSGVSGPLIINFVTQ